MTGVGLQMAMGAAQAAIGVGKKVGAAVKEKKANRQEQNAQNVMEADARRLAADAGNPLGNAAAQDTINAQRRELEAQANQQAAQAAMGGATPEMALAQSKQRADSISNTYSALAKQASDNYNTALSGVANVQASGMQKQADRLHNKADQLSQSADKDISAGMKTMTDSVGGAKSIGGFFSENFAKEGGGNKKKKKDDATQQS